MKDTNILRTLIEIYFNGAGTRYKFKGDIEESFFKQLSAVGYFIGEDTDGRTVIINPSNCGAIEIIKQRFNGEVIK